jgi:hypothetical protein
MYLTVVNQIKGTCGDSFGAQKERNMNFRVKGPKNTQTYRGLAKEITFGEFKALIAKDCGVPVEQQTCVTQFAVASPLDSPLVSFGMPMTVLVAADTDLVSAFLKSGEMITLELYVCVTTLCILEILN